MPDLIELRESLFNHYFSELAQHLPVKQLLSISDFAVKRQAELKSLLEEDDCLIRLSRADYFTSLEELSLDLQPHLFAQSLRTLRHKHFLRLYLRELANLASTRETVTDWSHFADAVITHVVCYCHKKLQTQYGMPCDEQGKPVYLYAITMGKLGGHELNFSSDVDLIFSFSKSGHTNGEPGISNQAYFTKLIQQFMHLLQNITADGLVFRVDLRLRPNGESGPLVTSIAAMETYYQEQGRDWERYAMVKARVLSFDKETTPVRLERLIQPFVYRRYVDFSVIESLRGMKAMIDREVRLNPLLDDIKRGRGGIREVEFIIQSFQLIRGGRMPHLQQQNAMQALHVLRNEELVAHTSFLEQGYWFLRKLENALQARNDQQTHNLPTDKTQCMQIALALGFDTWEEALKIIEQYRRIIHRAFVRVLGKADIYEDEKRVLANQLSSLWHGHVESNLAINLLASLGYQNPERCYQMINAFRHGPRCRRLTQTSRMRLDRFMVLLLNELKTVIRTDDVLLQVMNLLDNIVGRSAYLALLTENPLVLQELLHWFEQSSFITSLIVNQPFLLEVLIDQEKSWNPLGYNALKAELSSRLKHCTDEESCNEALKQFKLMNWLLAARAELYGECDALQIGEFLADVAEVIIIEALTQASNQLKARFPEITGVISRFAIIAYGKLGAREMNYNSDVDLVFLHAADSSQEAVVNRLTQKIIHSLTLRSQSGVLYPVDTRLRPSGSAGLLVSQFDAFIDYQRTQAWTWEHQALIRSRVIYANQLMHQQFKRLKNDVLDKPHDKKKLANDVKEMRDKISIHIEGEAIKHASGGLLDLEFLVQYLVLAHPDKNLADCTNTLEQLIQLRKDKVLNDEQFKKLKQAYTTYHTALHQSLLQSKTLDVAAEQKAIEVLKSTLGSF